MKVEVNNIYLDVYIDSINIPTFCIKDKNSIYSIHFDLDEARIIRDSLDAMIKKAERAKD